VAGFPLSPCYLLNGKKAVLFESGFSCVASLYEEDIRKVLEKREPDILFLTHVHYDHCGATSYLKRLFPSLRVAASEKAAAIIKRPNAQRVMVELSRSAASFIREHSTISTARLIDEDFQPFEVDMVLRDGQTIDLDGVTVRVMATPGHTNDMLSYYIPEEKILIGTEAVGCDDRSGQLIIEPLTDYDVFLSSLKRLATLDVEILCQGHHVVWVGAGEVRDFFSRSLAKAIALPEKVEQLLLEEDGAIERVVAKIKAEEYDKNTESKPPEEAYIMNVRVRVGLFAARMKGASPTVRH
jgi:glyoxylase-like metal-dependent hydrolase (beta-lactamase superfamily II)